MITAKTTLELKPRFTRSDLRKLASVEDGWRLSLFMPLDRTGREVRKAPILLKDLREQAAQALEERKVTPSARENILGVVDHILRESETSVLQGEGLAIYASEEQAFAYLLPVKPDPSATVDRRFRLDPVVPLLYEDGRFYLLALGLKDVRLFTGDRIGLTEISLHGIPDNLRDALRFEDSESYLNLHTAIATPGAGKGPAIYHGQGGGKGDLKEMKRDILEFFRQIDSGIRPLLSDPAWPLLLAGVEAYLPIYREANTYSRILDVILPAHLDRLSGESELNAQAWSICEREARAERRTLLNKYRECLATPWTAVGLTEVVPLSDQGRVSHLFLALGYRAWGAYDPSTGKVVPSETARPGDADLVGLATAQTILGSGNVYVVEPGEIPNGAAIAALCRY